MDKSKPNSDKEPQKTYTYTCSKCKREFHSLLPKDPEKALCLLVGCDSYVKERIFQE